MDTAIEWIVDFVEFLWFPLILLALYITGKIQDRKRRHRRGNGQQTYPTNHSDDGYYGNRYHSPGNDPDFSYMNHDDPDDSGQKDYRNESYGYGDQISPFNPDDQGAYEQMDDYNKNH